MGLALGTEIDLRLFFSRWHAGFAVTETAEDGQARTSLQFYDARHGLAQRARSGLQPAPARGPHRPGLGGRKTHRRWYRASLELFDDAGGLMAMCFGARKPGERELPAWRALLKPLPAFAGSGQPQAT